MSATVMVEPMSQRLRVWGSLAGLAAAYAFSVRLGLSFTAQPENLAALWPASGVALGALLASPRRRWPALLLVIMVVNFLGNWGGGSPVGVSLGFSLANIFESLAAAWVMHLLCDSQRINFTRMIDVLALCAAATVVNAVSAVFGSLMPVLAFGADFWGTWQVWWIADGLGMILVTPLVVAWLRPIVPLGKVQPAKHVEIAVLLLLTGAVAQLVFGYLATDEGPIYGYMVFPLLIWAGLRFSPRGATVVMSVFVGVAVWNTVQRSGASGEIVHTLKQQVFLSFIVSSGLILSTTITERRQAESALADSEERFRSAFDHAAYGMALTALDGRLLKTNQAFADMLGYSLADLQNWNISQMTHPEDVQDSQEQMRRLLAGESDQAVFLKRYLHRNGQVIWGEVRARLLRDAQGQPLHFNTHVQDVTERKRFIDQLQEKDYLLDEAQKLAHLGYYMYDILDGFWRGSVVLCREIFGIDESYTNDVQGWLNIVYPEDRQMMADYLIQEVVGRGRPFDKEYRIQRVDTQAMRWVHGLGRLNFDAAGRPMQMIGTIQDITERKQAENILNAALAEKEILLRELYHRTKNNMQVISSMLDMRACVAQDPLLVEAFREMGNRIYSMSLVHQKLYQSKNLSSIDLQEYVRDLAYLSVQSYEHTSGPVGLEFEMQNVMVLIDIAIPCGLVVNEILSNAFKYAFPDRRGGRIRICLAEMSGQVMFEISDNGVGLPQGVDVRQSNTLGLQTILDLVEKQLQGRVEVVSYGGTTFRFSFPLGRYSERV